MNSLQPPRHLSGVNQNNYGFTGEQQFAEENELIFLRARYYSPDIGRFIKRDPIGYRGGLNLYGYVGNNPVLYTDPSGLFGYGNYCGPGTSPGAGTPIDGLDGACKKHDECYSSCEGPDGIPGYCLPGDCERDCDSNLCVNAHLADCKTWSCKIWRRIIIGAMCGRAIAPF
jgi:RHS repeat-associated protein